MKCTLLLALVGLASATAAVPPTDTPFDPDPATASAPRAGTLRTDYGRERSLRVERETRGRERTVELEMERDGEPVDHPPGGGDDRSSARLETFVDTVTEHDDEGAPLAVTRSYELARIESGDDGDEDESPVEGEELRVFLDEDGALVVEGDGLDEELLRGQGLRLALDAFLPDDPEEVEAGDSWELDGEAVARGLGLEVAEALFPRPEIDFDELRARRERGEAGPAFLRRDTSLRLLRAADWDATATLTDEQVELQGTTAVVIELELEGSGALEEEGGFGRGRGRAFPAAGAPRAAFETGFELKLEGRLCFSLEEARPLSLELEGSFSIESETTRDMGGSSFSIFRVQEGTWSQSVTVSLEE